MNELGAGHDGSFLNSQSGTEQQPMNGEGHNEKKQKFGWRKWLETHFDWSWFACTQSTGGVAVLLAACPKQFHGLETIGVIVYIFNLVLSVLFTALMIARWISTPSTFRRCFVEAPECYFLGSFWLSIATNIVCMNEYGVPHSGPWLVTAIRVVFWTYAAVTFLSATIQLVTISQQTPIKSIEMNPAWFLVLYQTMLTGTIAGSIAKDQPPAQRVPIIVAGISYQGLGWLGSLLFLAWFIGHLMEKGWPTPSYSLGLFMTVAGVGFTITALIASASAIPSEHGYFASHPLAAEVLLIVATWVGIFMWLLGFALFAIALFVYLASVVVKDNGKWTFPMHFNNTWWGFVFPNVGFSLATVYIGMALESNAVLWVGTAMIILVVAAWLVGLVLMGKAIVVSCVTDTQVKLL